MSIIVTLLRFAARHGRLVLVLGLLAGITLPQLALTLKGYLPELIGFLLFVAALRIGPREAMGEIKDVRSSLFIILLFQLALPISAILLFAALGWTGATPFAIALMLAAPTISGGANMTIMTGNDATAALRMLVLGTLLVPLTVLPVFWLLPQLGSPSAVFTAATRLFVIIGLAVLAASIIRQFLLTNLDENQRRAMDGLAAITMAVVVIGLMSALGPALVDAPMLAFKMLAIVCAANFGLQLSVWFLQGLFGRNIHNMQKHRASYSIVAGNRNIGLFFTALPVAVTDPILLFIACYQVPMYLTPLALGWLYKRSSPGA